MRKGLVKGFAVIVCATMLLEGQVCTAFAEEVREEGEVSLETSNVEDFEEAVTVVDVEAEEFVEKDITPAKGSVFSDVKNDDFVIEDGVLTRYKGNDSKVEIPNGVKVIGDYAFYIYSRELYDISSSLEEVVIPEGVTDIGEGAFENCVALSKIELPESLRTIGSDAFKNCALREVKIPEGVTGLYGTFYGCYCLSKIELPSTIRFIGAATFAYQGNGSMGVPLLEELLIPKEVESISINHMAFLNNYNIKRIYIKSKDTNFEISDTQWRDIWDYFPTIYAPTGSKAEAYALKNGYDFVAWDEEEDEPIEFNPDTFDLSTATDAEKVAFVEYYIRQWKDSLKTEEERNQVREIYRTQTDVIKEQVKDSLELLGMSWEDAVEIAIRVFNE